ncbi:hypothetical protein AB2L28_05665 [Kineococcus sp. TBRC 1896]|uniref:Uncharacterized protein n=1 Tax=Kineococcus mangrovi TaxID=1660183 RepID=A0ABV4HZ71_9ACTN
MRLRRSARALVVTTAPADLAALVPRASRLPAGAPPLVVGP